MLGEAAECAGLGPRGRQANEAPRRPLAAGNGLDAFFIKTKTEPCIYWRPLSAQQILQKRRKNMRVEGEGDAKKP